MRRVLLASQSERRLIWLKENLESHNLRIESRFLRAPEIAPPKGMRVGEQVEAICVSKARNACLEQREYEEPKGSLFDAIVVSDTMVEDPDEPRLSMGKPTDFLGAAGMIIRLSGRRHVVWSSTTILLPPGSNSGGRIFEEGWEASTFTTSSTVEFVELEEEEISDLVSSESWRGKAGGYDLAGAAGEYCHLVEGEEVTVLGLSSEAMRYLTNVLSRRT